MAGLYTCGCEFDRKRRSFWQRFQVLACRSTRRNRMAMHKLTDAARWQLVLAKDKSADGKFFFSVRTTGVYCRPSCPARPARRENVAFHPTCDAAESAGFRACKRC